MIKKCFLIVNLYFTVLNAAHPEAEFSKTLVAEFSRLHPYNTSSETELWVTPYALCANHSNTIKLLTAERLDDKADIASLLCDAHQDMVSISILARQPFSSESMTDLGTLFWNRLVAVLQVLEGANNTQSIEDQKI